MDGKDEGKGPEARNPAVQGDRRVLPGWSVQLSSE